MTCKYKAQTPPLLPHSFTLVIWPAYNLRKLYLSTVYPKFATYYLHSHKFIIIATVSCQETSVAGALPYMPLTDTVARGLACFILAGRLGWTKIVRFCQAVINFVPEPLE